MKRCCFIGWVLLALAACSPVETRHGTSLPTDTSPELAAVDSLIWQRPDSALTQLLSCRDAMIASPNTPNGDSSETHSMRLYNGHYYQLLLAELLYKNDSAQANRTALQQAVAYFDSLADTPDAAFLAARAHYINGVGYYEQDSLVDACKEYIKALEMMEERFGEKELVGKKANFMALIYTRLTVLFSDLYLNKQAIYFGKLSLPYYERNKTSPWHLPWMLSKIGVHYNLMDELDSAAYYYQQANAFLPDTVNQTYRDLAARQALLSYQMEHLPNKTIMVLHRIADIAVSDDERLSRYLSIADIYYNEQQFDSAKAYFEQVYCNAQNHDYKMLAADRLREISMIDGDSLKANKYALARSQFTIEKDEEGNLNSELTTLCQQYRHGRQEIQHRQKTQKIARRWSFVMGAAILVVVVTVFILMMLKRRMRSEQYLHKMEQAALSGKLKKSNEALRETTKQLEKAIAEKEISGPALAKDYASFREAPICRQILETVKGNYFKSKMDCSAYKEYALGKEQLQSLRDSADEHMAQFTTRLRKQFPSLNEEDVNYCCLYLLGLNEAEISVLMQRAYPTVCERNRKIRRIIGEKNDLVFALRNF
jgi:tetratricopeptide (TPR) repeat protein